MEDKILQLAKCYKYITGRKVFDEHTNPEKTYNWLYLNKFIYLMEKSEVEWSNIIAIFKRIIGNAEKNKIRTLSCITNRSLIVKSCESINESNEKLDKLYETLERDYKFAKKNHFNFIGETDGVPNILKWYMAGKVSINYMAVSESCAISIINMSNDDRILLPPVDKISRLRIKYYTNDEVWARISKILKYDLFHFGG